MKKMLSFGLLAVALAASLPSCKKGENDPFLSLRSRKARVAGKWTVTGATGSGTTTAPNSTTTYSMTYDGTTETQISTTTANSVSITDTTVDTYTVSYEFRKDGTYTMTFTENGQTDTMNGTWIFLAKSKEDKLKGKEAILISTTSSGNGAYTNTMTGLSNDGVFVIDELRNKKMVLKIEDAYNDPDNASYSDKVAITLEQ